jgi:hypothetical protein
MALRGRPDVAVVDLREKSEREKHGVIPLAACALASFRGNAAFGRIRG